MKVRDLRQYIKTISKGNETLELVGSNKEYFLNMMSGQGQKVDALIAGAASFANNAKEQLFYEFVQNAYDASADSLFFYANEEFLIVLNNGEPFFTDLNIFDLRQFLPDKPGKSIQRPLASSLYFHRIQVRADTDESCQRCFSHNTRSDNGNYPGVFSRQIFRANSRNSTGTVSAYQIC